MCMTVYVECDAWSDEKPSGCCGWAGNVDVTVSVESSGLHSFEFVCPECDATIFEERTRDELPDFVSLFTG